MTRELSNYKNRCHVVIRASNERTVDLSALLAKEFFGSTPDIIKEVPFVKALEQSFKNAIASHKEWLICIDADVLIFDDGVSKLLKVLFTKSGNPFEIQGRIVDKFFPYPKKGGIHAYRISQLNEALIQIEKQKSVSTQRPEKTLINNMDKLGFKHISLDIIVGLHDFEQSNDDIYRKCFFHAQKHLNDLPTLIKYWREKSEKDMDYKIALLGAGSGIAGPVLDYTKKSFSHNEISRNQLSVFNDKKELSPKDLEWIKIIISENSISNQLKLLKSPYQKFKKTLKLLIKRK